MISVCELSFKSDLYVGSSIKTTFESVDFVVNLLKQRKSALDVYLICKDEGSVNFLEIIPATEIFKAIYSYKKYIVFGLARGKKEAFGMIATIYSDSAGKMLI